MGHIRLSKTQQPVALALSLLQLIFVVVHRPVDLDSTGPQAFFGPR
jgi:hypothetical protein